MCTLRWPRSLIFVLLVLLGAGCGVDSSTQDSGVIVKADSGSNPVDSGMPASDSGTQWPADSGTNQPVDAGGMPVDAGGMPSDAGALPDSGTPDAGPNNPVDAGVETFYSEATLRRRTEFLASDALKGRDEGTPESAAARQFIIDELTACGVAPQVTGNSFTQAIIGGNGTNILGWVQGTDVTSRERFVIVSAHYDHIGSSGSTIYNGAQDNATAVASVLAVACKMASAPLPRSVLIALWDAEEPNTFLTPEMGSQYWVAHPTVPLTKLDVALVLDLVGGNLWGTEQGHNVLGAESATQVRTALDSVPVPNGLRARLGGLHLAEETPLGFQPWSDYDAFRNSHIPHVFFSDGQNPRYHTVNDDSSFIDFPKLVKETTYLGGVTRALASASATPVWVDNGADYLRDANTVIGMLNDALAPTTGIVDSLGLSGSSKTKMQSDLTAVTAVQTKLMGGGTASSGDKQTLRSAIQRIICFAGQGTPQSLCRAI